jgi:hypothetical protein
MSATLKLDQVASVNIIRMRLGHESLDVTLAYLKARTPSRKRRRSIANSSLALYA